MSISPHADANGNLPERPFIPTHAQLKYLSKWLDPDAPDTITGLAKFAGVNRRSVYDWFEDPKFCLWFTERVERVFLADKHRMWRRCIELACRGSVDHIKLVAQRAGELRPEFPGNNETRSGSIQVFLNVPRPHHELAQAADAADVIDVGPALLPVAGSVEEH